MTKTELEHERMKRVDNSPRIDETSAEEEELLRDLYGDPDDNGFYTSEGGDEE